MRVKEIMTSAVTSVPPSTRASAAGQLMKAEHIHHLVVKDGERLVGVFSSSDVGSAKPGRDDFSVGDRMSEHVVTIGANAPLKRVANAMRGRNIGCLVVVEGGRPIGIVTTSDVLELLGRGAVRPNPVGRRTPLNHRAPHRKRNRSFGAW